MSLFGKIFGTNNTYIFTHPDGLTKTITATSLDNARKRMYSFVQSQMVGSFALAYHPEAVNKVMDELTVEEL